MESSRRTSSCASRRSSAARAAPRLPRTRTRRPRPCAPGSRPGRGSRAWPGTQAQPVSVGDVAELRIALEDARGSAGAGGCASSAKILRTRGSGARSCTARTPASPCPRAGSGSRPRPGTPPRSAPARASRVARCGGSRVARAGSRMPPRSPDFAIHWHVLDRVVDVIQVDEPDARAPLARLRAEVDEPAVVRANALAPERVILGSTDCRRSARWCGKNGGTVFGKITSPAMPSVSMSPRRLTSSQFLCFLLPMCLRCGLRIVACASRRRAACASRRGSRGSVSMLAPAWESAVITT